MFRSAYVNCTTAGATADGEPFAFVAGKHEQNFPYDTPASKWDSILLLVGGAAYAMSGRDLPGLALELDLGSDDGRARLRFEGRLRARDGRVVQGRVALATAFRRFPAFHLGQPIALSWLPGLILTPFELRSAPGDAGRVEVEGRSRAVTSLGGELEHGAFTGVQGRRLAIAYDYLALACPSYAYVGFAGYPLDGRGLVGRALRWFLSRTAVEDFTLSGGALQGDNPRAARHDVEVILTDTVDLGLADLDRQLVSSSDAAGTALLGLREVFRRKERRGPAALGRIRERLHAVVHPG